MNCQIGVWIMAKKKTGTELARREERDTALAVDTAAGRRLEKVTTEDGALILHGTPEAHEMVNSSFGSKSREFQTYCLTQLMAILPEEASKNSNDFTLPINSAV